MSNERVKKAINLDEDFGQDFVDSIVMAGMTVAMVMLIMPMVTQQISASYSRVQVLGVPPGTIAQNAGTMWYEVTALGQPNRLKMIGENSTGAFEEILVSLST